MTTFEKSLIHTWGDRRKEGAAAKGKAGKKSGEGKASRRGKKIGEHGSEDSAAGGVSRRWRKKESGPSRSKESRRGGGEEDGEPARQGKSS